ncbi:MAG: vWA domain-containing protein [Armatimonadota bacterium]
MHLISPWSLLWLLLLVPVIVFFYLLKLKRKEMVISSVLLWDHLVKDVQANAPFQKLKKNLLLLLQLLIALFCIAALARPAYVAQSLSGSNVVVILDGSASMQSRDADGGTRFDAARRQAQRMVADMKGGDRMMVLLAGARTHRLTSLTSDQNELRAALDGAKPFDTTTNLRDAMLLAVSVAGQYQGSRVFILSDGAFPELESLDDRGADLQFVRFGSRTENVGLVAMDVRRSFKDDGRYQMYLAVRNYSPEPKTTNLEFYRNDALIDVRPLELPAADPETGFSERAELFEDLQETTGILHARLDIKDDLPVDNEAYTQLSARREINVLLVTDGNLYLERALNVDPNVKVSRVAPSGYTGQSGFDVVVFENAGPKEVGPGAHLYINCGGPTVPVEIKGKVKDASVLTWDRVHPVMRYVKLNQLNMPEALAVEKKPWGVVLAEHESGPAVAIGETRGQKSAFVGFPLLQTDFPLRVAFPIFFNNLVQWLATQPGRTEGMQLRAGDTAPVEVPENVAEVTVRDPDGNATRVKTDGRLAYVSATERSGIYTVEAPNFKREFAVNLLSRDESETKPRDQIRFGRRPVLAGTGRVSTNREVWRWLLLAALVILAAEWWVFHKRI